MPASRWRATTSATDWRSVASSSAPARSLPSRRGRLPTWVVRIFRLVLRFIWIGRHSLLQANVQRLGELLHHLPFLLHGAAHLLRCAGRDRRAVLVEAPLQLRVFRRRDEDV